MLVLADAMPIHPPRRHHISPGTALHKPKDWPAFERLCVELLSDLLDDVHTDLNGRGGQRQAGIDLYGNDRRTGALVGVQCKKRDGRSYPRHAGLSIKELDAAVVEARTFQPALSELVILTTGPNDAVIQERARALSLPDEQGHAMRVVVHGWAWVEARAVRDPDIAVRHHLVALTEQAPIANGDHSRIACEIGTRLARAIDLMNERRRPDDRFTLQSLARHLGHPDWRLLEQLVAGDAKLSDAELETIAERLGLSKAWLIEGKGTPFEVDIYCRRLDSIGLHADIVAADPMQVVFVRQDDPQSDCHHVMIAIQLDEVRWTVLAGMWPVWAELGSGGREDLIALYCLIRRLEADTEKTGSLVFGKHLETEKFDQLSMGEIYPGSLFAEFRNDCWPQFLSSLSTRFLKLELPREKSLADTIDMLTFLVSEEGIRRHATGIAASLLRWADGEEAERG